MFGKKDIDGYCDYVFNELTDMKQNLAKIEEKAEDLSFEDKKTVSDNIFSHLNDLSRQIDSKLEAIGLYCPVVKGKIGERTAEYRTEKRVGTGV